MLNHRHAEYLRRAHPGAAYVHQGIKARKEASLRLSECIKQRAFQRRRQQSGAAMESMPKAAVAVAGDVVPDDKESCAGAGAAAGAGSSTIHLSHEYACDEAYEHDDDDNDETDADDEDDAAMPEGGSSGVTSMTAAQMMRALARAVGRQYPEFTYDALAPDLEFASQLCSADSLASLVPWLSRTIDEVQGSEALLSRLEAIQARWRHWSKCQPVAADTLGNKAVEALLLPLVCTVVTQGPAGYAQHTIGQRMATGATLTLQAVLQHAEPSTRAAIVASTPLLPMCVHVLAGWAAAVSARTATAAHGSLAHMLVSTLELMCDASGMVAQAMRTYAPPLPPPHTLAGVLLTVLQAVQQPVTEQCAVESSVCDAACTLLGTLVACTPVAVSAFEAAAPTLVALAAADNKAAQDAMSDILNALDKDEEHVETAARMAQLLVQLQLPQALVGVLRHHASAAEAATSMGQKHSLLCELLEPPLRLVDGLAAYAASDKPMHTLLSNGLLDVLAALLTHCVPADTWSFVFIAHIAYNLLGAFMLAPESGSATSAPAPALSLLLHQGKGVYDAIRVAGLRPHATTEVANECAWLLTSAIEAVAASPGSLATLARHWELPQAMASLLACGCADGDASLQAHLVTALYTLFDDHPTHLTAFVAAGGIAAAQRQQAHTWDALLASQMQDLLTSFLLQPAVVAVAQCK